MRAKFLAGLLLLAGSLCLADAPKAKITGTATVAPGSMCLLSGIDSVSDEPMEWELKSGPAPVVGFTLDQGKRQGVVYLVPQMPMVPGTYRFLLQCFGTPAGTTKLKADADLFDVTVTGTVPVPVPIDPTPKPPDIDPTPPIPSPQVGKLRLIFWHESNAKANNQQLILQNSTVIRPYMNTHCDSDMTGQGKIYAWRFLDQNSDTSRLPPGFSPLLDRLKAPGVVVPSVAISVNGGVPIVQPTPASEAELLTLLRKYGGD